jgi:hypothetical protein
MEATVVLQTNLTKLNRQGIVPTLIIVRMGLGISTEDAQTAIMASGIRFEHHGDLGDEEAGTRQ